MSLLNRLSRSKLVEVLLTLIVYAIYVAVVAASLAPSIALLMAVLPQVMDLSSLSLRAIVLASVMIAAAFYIYLLFGSAFQAVIIRLLSLGITAGRYPAVSATTLRWLIYSGIYTISVRTILPLIPMTVFINTYFRIIGCRMGRNVKLNTFMLNDAYLLTLEDDVIVGGDTDISCHLFENNHLTLKPIRIGKGTLVGAHCYISPGVDIGEHCVIGLHSFIRSDHVIEDRSVITSLAAIDVRTAREIERKQIARALRDSKKHRT